MKPCRSPAALGLAFALAVTSAPAADFDTAHLIGTVMDPSGKPVPGAVVRVNRVSGAAVASDKLPEGITGPDGRSEVTFTFTQDKTLAVREVFVEKRGYARGAFAGRVSLRNGETGRLAITLASGEVFAGTVRLPLLAEERMAGRRPGEVQRLLEVAGPSLEGLSENARVYQTEPGGRFEFYLPPGEFTARILDYPTAPSEPAAQWKGLRPGQSNLVLELPAFDWSEAELGRAFDGLWSEMDRRYSYFFLKKDVDWNALKAKCRPQTLQARNPRELTGALQQLLAPLHDLHVWVDTPEGRVGTYQPAPARLFNRQVVLDQLEQRIPCGVFALVGRTKPDGFGYFLMLKQGAATPADVTQALAAIEKLREAPGFIVDLRDAHGGSEPLAKRIASLFCAQDTIYARSKFREGPGHTDFGKTYDRVLPATTNAYVKPVVCLIGPGAVSSGEAFVKMMKCLPQVTTVGQRTRGASGNPVAWPVSRTGLTVYYSRWVDLLPNNETFEGTGIPPAVEVNEPREAYDDADPTLAKGVEILRQRVASSKER